MQIIIRQAEIEEAIRDHILASVNVEENMEITIDLRATRGTDGYQAMIDIHPEGQAPVRAAKSAGKRGKSSSAGSSAPPSSTSTAPAVPSGKRRGRRSKAQIEADRLAAEAADQTESSTGQPETAQEAPQKPANDEPTITTSEDRVEGETAPATAQTVAEDTESEAPVTSEPTSARPSLFGNLQNRAASGSMNEPAEQAVGA